MSNGPGKAGKASADAIIDRLRTMGSQKGREGMARYGIRTDRAFGVSIYVLRRMAREIGTDHAMALALWETGYHEARLLASIVDDPEQVTEEQMCRWVADFDSWDICDQVCSNLFDRTTYAWKKAFEWAEDGREFVRRAGFVIMAALAVHDKKADDAAFEQFYPVMKKHAMDDRNYVRKAVNWALRNIGKRNMALNASAIKTAREIQAIDSRAARWIAADALRELQGDRVRQRLMKKR